MINAKGFQSKKRLGNTDQDFSGNDLNRIDINSDKMKLATFILDGTYIVD